MKLPFLRFLTLGLIFIFLSACSSGGGGGGGSANVASESAYCSSVRTYSPAVTVTGTAVYYYRPIHATSHVLSGNPVSDTIAAAEVVVTDSAGNEVQCSSVDGSGNISLSLPKTAGTYTVKINSRANNSLLKASVLDDINANNPYSISKTITLDGTSTSQALGQVTAYARQSESAAIEGAAFNILKQLYKTNDYIRTKINDTSWVAEKVTAYWKAGFNPYSYFGYPSTLLSFYAAGERKLYILGGKDGNVKTSDTDHFDNSVIIHEYGHFLEDVYGKSDSPGGSHNGNMIIDARLAWSEGWANFLQAAVLGTKNYADTAGYCNDTVETSGSCTLQIYFRLDESGASASMDAVSFAGEGVFRELSVTRSLYKSIATPISTSSSSLGAGLPFSEIWNIFAGSTTGFHSSAVHFRNSGKFIGLLNSVVNTATYSANQAAWSAILTNEKQPTDTKYYANPVSLTPSASCSKFPISLDPVVQSSSRSNQFRSNHFYEYYYNGSTNDQISLTYSQAGAQTIDLDLVVYKQDYVYFEESDEDSGKTNSTYVVRSVRRNPTFESGSESISMTGQPAGFYIINVRAATYGKITAQLNGTATYTLNETATGKVLCPTY